MIKKGEKDQIDTFSPDMKILRIPATHFLQLSLKFDFIFCRVNNICLMKNQYLSKVFEKNFYKKLITTLQWQNFYKKYMRKFLKEFIKNPKTVGSIIPSSSRLAHSMTKHIDFSRDVIIVEFGPWIWVFTKEVLKKATKNSQIFVFEVQDNFVEELNKIGDPRLVVIHDWAQNIDKYLGDKKADAIISGLPFGSLPKELTSEILAKSHKHLKLNWMYIQFQYFLQNKKDIFNTFKNHSITWQPINFPPAFVYKCHKIHF